MAATWIDAEIESVVRRIRRDADQLCARLPDGLETSLADEDDFTSEFARAIRQSLDGVTTGGITWAITPRKLTSRGPGAEEAEFGADLGIVFRLDTPDLSYQKGILVQAKVEDRVDRDGLASITSAERKRLLGQCRDMLQVTPESFVWLYREGGLEVYKASAITARTSDEMTNLRPSKIGAFFRDALRCTTGDTRLVSTSRDTLDQLLEERRLKLKLDVSGRGARPRSAERVRVQRG